MFQPNQPGQGPDIKNLIIALVLCTAIMGAWQYFYERPRLEAQRIAAEKNALVETVKAPVVDTKVEAVETTETDDAPRLPIRSNALHGTINLKGARFDDLTLANYHETLEKGSPEVRLLNERSSKAPYFAEFGVLPAEAHIAAPDGNSLWQSGGRSLSPEHPVTLEWQSGGLKYEKTIHMDEHYMFTVTLTVHNDTGEALTFFPYGLVNRTFADTSKHMYILHEGPLGVLGNELKEISYESLRDDGPTKLEDTKGWLGITDKYWLSAIVPDKGEVFDASFRHITRDDKDAYQIDARGESFTVDAGKSHSVTMRLFAGAKKVELLDQYASEYNIPLFDRAVDFGMLYFLTRPMFELLTFFQSHVGNFGIAILLLTVTIKLIMFPLANKSYTSMSQMKLLTPKMMEIREKFADDKMKMNQEIMEMYKREKVNPLSGCLPILIQIPVFFALYKVLFVTIEMRHAPFYGWIHDLSAMDPTNLFTLFGLVPWDAPSFLHLGALPIIMCATMVLQQKLNPKPTDEVQAMVIGYMPYIFLFLFATFPAGLVLYWAWNNTLSIAQQWFIQRRLEKKGLRPKNA
ncbi:MAG: membrane protein insertase YidC [Alphaproteobacteria bacterium]|nr:membrane protein insertase YidC [Alphaproteobacteria bacterium]